MIFNGFTASSLVATADLLSWLHSLGDSQVEASHTPLEGCEISYSIAAAFALAVQDGELFLLGDETRVPWLRHIQVHCVLFFNDHISIIINAPGASGERFFALTMPPCSSTVSMSIKASAFTCISVALASQSDGHIIGDVCSPLLPFITEQRYAELVAAAHDDFSPKPLG